MQVSLAQFQNKFIYMEKHSPINVLAKLQVKFALVIAIKRILTKSYIPDEDLSKIKRLIDVYETF